MPIEEAKKTIHLRAPYPNDNCMQCHSTRDELWLKVPDHEASLEDVRAGRVSCASAGCHGLAHPFFQPREEKHDDRSSRRRGSLAWPACSRSWRARADGLVALRPASHPRHRGDVRRAGARDARRFAAFLFVVVAGSATPADRDRQRGATLATSASNDARAARTFVRRPEKLEEVGRARRLDDGADEGPSRVRPAVCGPAIIAAADVGSAHLDDRDLRPRTFFSVRVLLPASSN